MTIVSLTTPSPTLKVQTKNTQLKDVVGSVPMDSGIETNSLLTAIIYCEANFGAIDGVQPHFYVPIFARVSGTGGRMFSA